MENILFVILGVFLIYIFGKILLIPMKHIIQLIGNGITGGITLFLFNIIGKRIGLMIDVTPLNAIVSGFFGVPGVVIILILENFF